MKMKTKLSTLEKKLDKIFSEYIRLNYSDDWGFCTCVNCGKRRFWRDIDAGHFYSRRNKSVRWDEMNVHPECMYCNRFSSEPKIGYMNYMLETYGSEKIVGLTDRKNITKKWSRAELQELIDIYTERVKQLKREKEL